MTLLILGKVGPKKPVVGTGRSALGFRPGLRKFAPSGAKDYRTKPLTTEAQRTQRKAGRCYKHCLCVFPLCSLCLCGEIFLPGVLRTNDLRRGGSGF
jgi:hypothetical protein